MARRVIIGEILNLIKGLGGNPSKFMGTKSNINFLGKGPKEALFQGQIDIDGLMRSGFPLERVITEAETAGGYATANKLNDLQLKRLKDNLITLQKAYKPEQIPNITDLATGTGDLTQQGLASLRRPGLDELGFSAKRSKDIRQTLSDELAGAEGVETAETILPTSNILTRIAERMKNIQKMSDDLGQIGKGEPSRELTGQSGIRGDIFDDFGGVRSTFNPRNEVHVKKAEALLKDPQLKGVYTEAEVKNAYDFDGLYQAHFDKGHVDVARLFEQAGYNIPQMRASARDALLQLMKKEKGLPGAESGLRDFVSAEDFKYISEGGGGRAGDPINLMVKYFGKNVTENLPKSATKENIDRYTDFIMAAKDKRGRGIDDPFFDRETIDFSTFTRAIDDIPFATGGRVNKASGGLAKILEV